MTFALPLETLSAAMGRLSWPVDGTDWPNRASSRFVDAAGLSWHVQVAGSGPVAVLLHGTGSSTHSWAHLLPRLQASFTVVAPDLPGHGFSGRLRRDRPSLEGIAAALRDLFRALDIEPQLYIGHSAGAAIGARLCLDSRPHRIPLVSLNGALLPLPGWQGALYSPLAKLVVLNPLAPHLVAWCAADGSAVRRLLDSTGSSVDAATSRRYARLLRTPAHVAGTLEMLAAWDLRPLARELPRLGDALTLVVGDRDGTVPPTEAQRVHALVPDAHVAVLAGLGHLAHEEDPESVARLVAAIARREALGAGAPKVASAPPSKGRTP
ncbi:MAG TPA: alpha/beta fold hydrolase BchO [Burkholderiaceae bacterium]|nr:alpha/beta fold hydrolase BchO [Burkholderiaceae bacterium]